jgi:hypothetical protein
MTALSRPLPRTVVMYGKLRAERRARKILPMACVYAQAILPCAATEKVSFQGYKQYRKNGCHMPMAALH